MSLNRRRHRTLLRLLVPAAALAVHATVLAVRHARRPAEPATPPAPPPPVAAPATPPAPTFRLADLTPAPDWSELAAYHGAVTREDFLRLLTEVFTAGEAWRDFIEVGSRAASIETVPGSRFVLRFASAGETRSAPRFWRPAGEFGPPPPGQPLAGLHIVIDPGHLGGPWARIEERWFSVDGAPPVTEGDLTLAVAKLLEPRLKALGAKVSLVRTTSDPVTPLRPDLIETAVQAAADDGTADDTLPPAAVAATPRRTAERLFYRTAEIRARAEMVNARLLPDLVLCLHFNAEAWGDPARPALVPANHFHLLLSGALTDEEVALPDQRFEMLRKLLAGVHAEEAAVSATVAEVFAAASGLPPYRYDPDSPRARNVAANPYLWARNLLANRLYQCPVVFLEPYVMNSPEVHARIQAGDYEGTREIAGAQRPSIFREYADALAAGLAKHYHSARNRR
jgi:N-acetylmuramoyl-L-alanine amidase